MEKEAGGDLTFDMITAECPYCGQKVYSFFEEDALEKYRDHLKECRKYQEASDDKRRLREAKRPSQP